MEEEFEMPDLDSIDRNFIGFDLGVGESTTVYTIYRGGCYEVVGSS